MLVIMMDIPASIYNPVALRVKSETDQYFFTQTATISVVNVPKFL